MMIILIGLLGFIVVAGLGMALAGGDNAQTKGVKRAQAIRERTRADRPRGQTRKAADADPGQRRKQILKSLKEQERRQRKATLTLAAKMQQAGLGSSLKPFWIASGILAGLGFLVPLMFGLNPLLCLGVAFALGMGLPRWVVGFLGKRRTKKFSESFADAIDVIVRGIKSGLPVHDCLKIIARESPEPLKSEFVRLVDEIGVGMSVEDSLEKMYGRMPTPELRFFTIVLAIQAKTGGNLAEALANLSVVLRSRKMMREKIKAMSSEALASAGIIGSLPPAVVVLIGITSPAYMSMMFTDKRGHMLLLIAITLMGMGIFVMRRMINFKI